MLSIAHMFLVVASVATQGASSEEEWENLPFSGVIVSRQADGSEIYEMYRYSEAVLKVSNETVRVLNLMSRGVVRRELELSEQQEQTIARAFHDLDRSMNKICIEFTVDGGDSRSINFRELYEPLITLVRDTLDEAQSERLRQLTARDYASRVEFDSLIRSPLWQSIGVVLTEDEKGSLHSEIEKIKERLEEASIRAREQALQELIDSIPASERGKVEAVFGRKPVR